MARRSLTRGQRWWRDLIEARALERLRQLRAPRPAGRPPLWDGAPPVPVDHVIEHCLGLSFDWDEIEEREGEEILGSLRPETGEIVLNTRHRERFARVPGTERSTKGHEAGHADLFGDVARAMEQMECPELLALSRHYQPRMRSTSRGHVRAVRVRFQTEWQAQLAGETREFKTAVMHAWREQERERTAGRDSDLVRRAVDYYAAVLLMPEPLVRETARGLDLSRWTTIRQLAAQFQVSTQTMGIRLEEIGMIYEIQGDCILLSDPAEADQCSLF